MPKIDKMLVMGFILILAGYSVHMNIKLNKTISQYEADSLEMSGRFEKMNEEMIRGREDIAAQKADIENARVAIEENRAQALKTIADVRQEPVLPAVKKEAIPPLRADKQIARERAEKAKAEVEAMLGQMNKVSEPWEKRESHL